MASKPHSVRHAACFEPTLQQLQEIAHRDSCLLENARESGPFDRPVGRHSYLHHLVAHGLVQAYVAASLAHSGPPGFLQSAYDLAIVKAGDLTHRTNSLTRTPSFSNSPFSTGSM